MSFMERKLSFGSQMRVGEYMGRFGEYISTFGEYVRGFGEYDGCFGEYGEGLSLIFTFPPYKTQFLSFKGLPFSAESVLP
ncbi:hypothetical protein LRR81_10130 [Metabacillus sp. GX 13764]|uniref:hypothetical protein n=1 Tax=Metabacillus kandeliae TaxID=2900151 RepID=UPI001E327841|nr:hypothetical protein [Metabacillus kandeliae]MCD7034598.1 hypothetical protein [Metabacillus kandeliae]